MCHQKNDSPLDNFTISPLHPIMISLFHHMCKIYWFTITTFGKQKTKWPISPLNNIDTFQSSYHITTSLYHAFTNSLQCYKCEPMCSNKKIGDKIKLLKNNLNLPISPYKHTSRDIKDNQTDNSPAEKKTPFFKNYPKSQMK